MCEAKFTVNNDTVIVLISGRLDSVSSQEMQNKIVPVIEQYENIIFDLKNLEYMSSVGLRLLLLCRKNLRPDGNMEIINANEFVWEVLEVTGFSEIFNAKRN